jgi:hypothetical protein
MMSVTKSTQSGIETIAPHDCGDRNFDINQ